MVDLWRDIWAPFLMKAYINDQSLLQTAAQHFNWLLGYDFQKDLTVLLFFHLKNRGFIRRSSQTAFFPVVMLLDFPEIS